MSLQTFYGFWGCNAMVLGSNVIFVGGDLDFPEKLIDMALKEFGEVKVRLDSGVMTTMSSLIAQKPSSRGHISISDEISEANFINKSIEYQESSKENFRGKNFSG
jgi:hypothetical protein